MDMKACVTNFVIRYVGERPLTDDGSRALMTIGYENAVNVRLTVSGSEHGCVSVI